MKKQAWFKESASIILLVALCVPSESRSDDKYYRDISPDTWVATDALGRAIPDFSVVGPVKENQRRVVGIFYITWHGDGLAAMKSPYAADVYNGLEKLGAPIRWIRNWSDKDCRRRIHGKETTGIYGSLSSEGRVGGNSWGGDAGRVGKPV